MNESDGSLECRSLHSLDGSLENGSINLVTLNRRSSFFLYKYIAFNHRRRINTEEKTKVVAAVWGTEFIKFPAALAILN